jgi:hypothetical protein
MLAPSPLLRHAHAKISKGYQSLIETVKDLNGLFADAKELVSVASVLAATIAAIVAGLAARRANQIAIRPYRVNLNISAFWAKSELQDHVNGLKIIRRDHDIGNTFFIEISNVEGKNIQIDQNSFLVSVPFLKDRFRLPIFSGLDDGFITLHSGESRIFGMFETNYLIEMANKLPISIFPKWRFDRMQFIFRSGAGDEFSIPIARNHKLAINSRIGHMPLLYRDINS